MSRATLSKYAIAGSTFAALAFLAVTTPAHAVDVAAKPAEAAAPATGTETAVLKSKTKSNQSNDRTQAATPATPADPATPAKPAEAAKPAEPASTPASESTEVLKTKTRSNQSND